MVGWQLFWNCRCTLVQCHSKFGRLLLRPEVEPGILRLTIGSIYEESPSSFPPAPRCFRITRTELSLGSNSECHNSF